MTIFAKLALGFGTALMIVALTGGLILWNIRLLCATDEHVRDRVSFNEVALTYRHAAQEATLGASQLAATGTLGGHLHGAPAYLSELMRVFGWDVYHTFYSPTWVLLVLAVVIVVMPALAIVTTRGRAVRPQRQEAGK